MTVMIIKENKQYRNSPQDYISECGKELLNISTNFQLKSYKRKYLAKIDTRAIQ